MEIIISGKTVLIDDDDYEKVSSIKWTCGGGRYGQYIRSCKDRTYLHRFIMDAPKNKQVDHINRNTLDNRKCNLRLCDPSDNSHNVKRNSRNTTGYKGVYFHKSSRKYMARLQLKGKYYFLGEYKTAIEAYEAYCRKAKELYGEYANFG